ncbi:MULTISPECIES: acyl-CoA dehydrogenase family protein [Hydrocarboniphaga]|jgi:acyl-CoA dehydrogenase|uniref:acyl-CoA dehydrogenase family protein n=1 Tax=Hydrocarboniphaga TaxID=243627 RepID=UPI002ABCB557|nr:acyl-CoA dehydrogenase family protein [Hydrocarboniphaga sp.]MDZ4078931.1 acyl-CoA dehydrogenase family protein [Hydrocarboniphaga sp.]
MDFDFSDEQKVIRDEARKLLAAQCDLKRVRRVLEGEASFDRELWQTIAEAGWIGSAIGEEHGGLGLGRVTLCVIAEELGRALAPVPVAASIYLAAEALALSNHEALAAELLPKLASGELIGTLALTEGVKPLHALDAIETKVIDGRLTGSKLPVLFGHIADFALVAAKNAAGVVGLYRLDLNAQGVERTLLDSIDPTLPLARIEFTRVACTLLIEDATALLPKLLDRAAVFLAFEQIGAATAALEMSCDYARIRQAFGRPIGSFQAIKHKLAEMYTKIEIARSNAFYAAWALEADAPELALAAAAARLAATDAFEWTAKETIQTHGGIGATWEADPHLFYRRSRALASLLDTSLAWRERLVHELELHFAA